MSELSASKEASRTVASYDTLAQQLGQILYMGSGHALVGELALDSAKVLTPEEIYQRIETQGVVKNAPLFSDQVEDDSRTMPFRYHTAFSNSPMGRKTSREPKLEGRTTEIKGLRELQALLAGFVTAKATRVAKNPDRFSTTAELVHKAADMLENLTFIGGSEYAEAAAGLGAYWKGYLDADPRNTICVLTEMNSLARYRHSRKSDDYVKDRVLQTFSPMELQHYSGRIVEGIDDVKPDDQYVRVIMVDDWAISGKGLRDGYNLLRKRPVFRAMADAGQVEINLLVASDDRVRNGLPINPTEAHQGAITVRAYFRSHYGKEAHAAHRSYVTGVHSSANYSFAEICNGIARKSQGFHRITPKLARILPIYRDQEDVVKVDKTGLER